MYQIDKSTALGELYFSAIFCWWTTLF